MELLGDSAAPGTKPATPAIDNTTPGKMQPDQNQATHHYDDDSGEDAQHGITGPIPDDGSVAQSLARAMDMDPEYSGASRFAPANKGNYKAVSGTRTINQIV